MTSFTISDDEIARCETWQASHEKECKFGSKTGTIGDRYSYVFTPTALGTIVSIQCPCGGRECLTNFEDW